MSDDESSPSYWFRAKSYGYGWGLPLSWQGWVVYAGYLVLVLAPLTLGSLAGALAAGISLLIFTPMLVWICRKKGEPTQWRWGRR